MMSDRLLVRAMTLEADGVLSVELVDPVLTDREKAAGDCMMVCVSRACGKRLVLGL